MSSLPLLVTFAAGSDLRTNPHLGNELVRAVIFGVASFTITIFAGPYFIRLLRSMNLGKTIREELPQHLSKSGTPSMGGFLFTVPVVAITVVYNLVNHLSMLLPVVVVTLSSALGWVDDRLTTVRIRGEGLRARFKFAWLLVIAVAIVTILHVPHFTILGLNHGPLIRAQDQNKVYVPVAGWIDLGIFYSPLAVLAIVATANAVNLTDGLDGLAAGTGAIALGAFGGIALLSGAAYTYLSWFCFTMVGALLAFLWFNVFPARIIMGDTGALALGAVLATIALMLHQMLILSVVGFVFVIETFSVILQVGYFRLTGGKRIFRSAPLHNHLELLGWHENEVTQRFWIVSMLAAIAGLTLAFI